jgi:hypothetical protein
MRSEDPTKSDYDIPSELSLNNCPSSPSGLETEFDGDWLHPVVLSLNYLLLDHPI